MAWHTKKTHDTTPHHTTPLYQLNIGRDADSGVVDDSRRKGFSVVVSNNSFGSDLMQFNLSFSLLFVSSQ